MSPDTFAAFAISRSGMAVEKTRMDISAHNLANLHSSGADGAGFRPLRVVSGPRNSHFGAQFDALGAVVVAVREAPGQGAVGVDQTTELVQAALANRAYQANVAAFGAARSMALKALEIGADK